MTKVTSLDAIIGQSRAIETLRAAVRSERVHHAWIFAGPPGVGKRTTAEAFAALLLDPTTGPTLTGQIEPDPESETQRLAAEGTHPDLHVITKELAAFSEESRIRNQKQRTIAKEVIEKHLLDPIALASTMPGGMASKVFIVDEAELMDASMSNATTQNAMLKTLEEPPAGAVVILVTAREERLLPTVRSRCHRVSFGVLDDAAMDAWFDVAELDVSKTQRAWLTRFAGGSPGRAVVAAETGLDAWAETLEPMLSQIETGRFSRDLGSTMAKLIDEWAKAWVKRGEKAGGRPSKEAANHLAARHLFTLLSEWARTGLRAAATGDAHDAMERSARAIDLIGLAESQMLSNVRADFVLDNLAAQLVEA
ncbi:MAG: AAA family ATPase [Planctomycetota bacterium]